MNKTLINQAILALDIQAIFLRSAEIKCHEGFPQQFIESEPSLTPQYRAGLTGQWHVIPIPHRDSVDSHKIVLFFFTAGVRLIDSASENLEEIPDNDVLIEITAQFCAQYSLKDGIDEISLKHALEEFGRHNVGYHVWPYWREYVQSSCGRLGIPPIPIPMYQLPQPSSAGDKTPPTNDPQEKTYRSRPPPGGYQQSSSEGKG